MDRIPTKARQVVEEREQGRCLRCSGPTAEWAHRRTRSVHDEHTMCPCNGVRLCATCHQWCHHNPTAATIDGFMVSRHVGEPGCIAVRSWYGTIWLHCDGGIDFTEESWRTNKERSTT